ncbi:MAG: hypothetical protein ACI4C7_02925 [Clostridia bacterium]
MKKNFITGFICGGIICATVTGFTVEYTVTNNPYPVKVNGIETSVEGYNINDSTYFKLRDVADAVGSFRVDFVNNEIILTNIDHIPISTQIPETIQIKKLSELTEGETVDGLLTELIDGTYYVDQWEIKEKYKGDYAFKLKDNDTYKIGWRDFIFFDNYPQGGEYNLGVELTWYNTVLQPWLANEGWKQE